MKYITYALAYLWCTFAIYTLRFDSDSVSWLDVALRSLIYATAFFLPSFCLLCHGLKRRCQHQRASASNLRSTTPADAIGRAAACNEAPLLSAASQKTDSNSLPSFQPSQQYAFRSYPAAQHGSQQSQLLLPPEISLREWKRSSTKADDSPTTEDAVSSRLSPDATASPPCPAYATAAGECPFAPLQGLESSSLISSSKLKQLKSSIEETCSTDEACLHAPVSSDTCFDSPAYLLLDESAESAGSVQGTDGMRMTPGSPCSTTIPPCSNISSCDRADAAHHLAPAAALESAMCAADSAIQREAVSCNVVHSASITALSVAASCDVQCKVPAMPCTAATCTGGPATPSQSLQTQLPAVDEPAAAPFTSKPPSPAAAAQHQEPQPEISLLLQAEDAEQSCFVLSPAAQTAVSALGDAASQDNHKLQEGYQHHSHYYPYRCAQSPAATPTAAGQTDALRAAATSLSPSPADLTIITARRTKSEAPQQQQQHSDEDHSSEVSSVASIEQPTTPVFISTSTRYMKTLSRTTSSLASGFSCSLSSSGSTAAAAAVIPPPLPSPAESPLARRLTNDRDEVGYPTSPGLVELLQQREQRRSHGACVDSDNQQQQLAPWAGLQLRSVARRRWSGDLNHQNRVRGAISRSQSCLSGGSSSKGAKQHCCSSSVDGGDQKGQQRCDSYALMMTESASEDCSSSGSSSEQLVCVGERADAVAAQEPCSSSTPYQQLLALYEGVSG